MKNLVHLAVVIFFCLCACQPSGLSFTDAVCIEHLTIIDPEQGQLDDQTVIIKDGKILKVAPTQDLRLDKANDIIDGTGKYMIPGLWDAHVHFAYIEDLAPRMFDLFLGYGITSVRDTGGRIEFVKKWKDKAVANQTKAPRVMIAGPLLDGMPNVYDGSVPSRPPLSVGSGTVEELVENIEMLDEVGVDLLKAYEMLSPEQLAKAGELAKEKGLPLTGHVPLSMDVISASNAGLNSMEHLRNLELSCASNADELLEQRRRLLTAGKKNLGGVLRSKIHQAQRQIAVQNYDENKAQEVLAVLAKNETWQIPTLALNSSFVEKHFTEAEWQKSFVYLPDTIEQQWISSAASIKGTTVTPFREQYNTWMFDMVGKVHKAGIDIMAGTDCPIFMLTPGRSLHQELEVLVKAGLSPMEALKTATVNPARYFGLEKELGTVAETKWADLLILDANPLEDISNTQRIHAVIKQGELYDRAALDDLFAGLREE